MEEGNGLKRAGGRKNREMLHGRMGTKLSEGKDFLKNNQHIGM